MQDLNPSKKYVHFNASATSPCSLSDNFLLGKPPAQWLEQLPIPEPAHRIPLPVSMDITFFVHFNLIPLSERFAHAMLFDGNSRIIHLTNTPFIILGSRGCRSETKSPHLTLWIS